VLPPLIRVRKMLTSPKNLACPPNAPKIFDIVSEELLLEGEKKLDNFIRFQ